MYYQHDLVGLHSEDKTKHDVMARAAAMMPLAPKLPPATTSGPDRKATKPGTKKVVKKAPSLLDFGGVNGA